MPHSLVITNAQLCFLKFFFLHCEPRAKQVFAVMITPIYPYTDMQLNLSPPFEVVVKELLVFGRKSQLLFLQWKVKGHAELLGSGGRRGGRGRQWLTDVYRGLTALL